MKRHLANFAAGRQEKLQGKWFNHRLGVWGAAEKEGEARAQPGFFSEPGRLLSWPPSLMVLRREVVLRWAEPRVEELNRSRGLQRERERAVCGRSVRSGIGWCLVLYAEGEVGRSEASSPVRPGLPSYCTEWRGYQQVSLLRRLVLTGTSRGFLIWINPPGLYCV